MSNLIEEFAKKKGMCLRPLKDLPPEQENRFQPNSFVTRKWLEHFREAVKEEIRPYVLAPPPDVAGYESDGYYRRAVTWEKVMERRRQRQRTELERKRSNYDVVYSKPLYVWVFWCPGINNFFFKGWWTYFVGFGHEYHGGGFKGNVVGELWYELLRLFPLLEANLFETQEEWRKNEEWMKRFVKKYRRGTRCGRPQGKALVWAEVYGSRIVKILGKAEWPNRKLAK